ncbi:sulfite exporter TauE/SafE family protein [Candidatus Pyrohabitans sp.]
MHYPVAGTEANFLATLAAGFLIGAAFSTLSVSGAAFTSLFQALIGVTTALQPINVLSTSLAALTALRTYLRERRAALPIAGLLIGGVALGVLLGSRTAVLAFGRGFSGAYLAAMGIIALLTGSYIAAHTFSGEWRSESALVRMVRRFEGLVQELRRTGEWRKLAESGFATVHASPHSFTFTFAGEKLSLSPVKLALGGAAIGFVSSLFGIGGGNLFLFLLASVYRLPMHLAVGTALTAVLFTSLWSCANYLLLGMRVDWVLFLNLAPGLVLGALLAPRYAKLMPELWLRRLAGGALIFAGSFMLWRGVLS